MRRWKGWQAWVLTVVVLSVVCAVGWVWWRGRATRTAEGSVAYRVVAVRRGPIEVAVRATGTVQAVERRELRAGVGGKVARVQFARGERVKAGQVLIELSDENQRAKLEKAGLSLEQEQRNLDQLLQKQDALVVKAPVRGRVADVPVAEGQRVGEDTPVASIVDDTHLEVRAQFTKAQVDKISIGQAAHVFLPDYFSTVSGQVTAVNRLGQAGGAGAVLYPVTIQVENPGGLEVGAVAVAYVESSSGELAAMQTSPLAEPGPRVVRAQVGGTVARLSVRKGDGV
ncbi:MAG TPA: HlyD family efflux transporter periplasmic adaptor subunit, partial [Firmicutes bacterium]|nr:HlyD family efflux transporter periplasmic adaptor subunit [Bacillota bacterium]